MYRYTEAFSTIQLNIYRGDLHKSERPKGLKTALSDAGVEIFLDILPLLDRLTVVSDRKHKEEQAMHASKAPGQIQSTSVVP